MRGFVDVVVWAHRAPRRLARASTALIRIRPMPDVDDVSRRHRDRYKRRMRVLCLLSTLATCVFVVLTADACPVTIQQPNGEGEGEGIPIGGEGEGEGLAGEGEGEGEGFGGEGEGEGEGVAGEGEGEGVAGEGEGEGTTSTKETTAAGCTQTTPTSNTCCADGLDNDNNGFIDCKDFACIGDDHCSVGTKPIQSFMDKNGGVTAVSGVTIAQAIVTGKTTSSAGNVTVFIQMAQGDQGGTSDTYPDFSGTEVFVQSASVGSFADLGSAAIGDCVTVSGSVDLFHSTVQLSHITAFSKVTAGCGSAPTASTQSVANINDSGAQSRTFVDTVVTISNVTCDQASSGNNGSFEVKDASGNKIFVSGFLLSTKPTTAVNATFTSITGILTEFDDTNVTPTAVHFDVTPRTASDIVP
jgi:hypothetical protein